MSDEAGIFFAMLLLGLVGMAATAICADQHITPAYYEWASQACASNEGLRTLSADVEDLTAMCQNGARFEAMKSRVGDK